MIRKETRLTLREGRETRRRVGFMPLHLRRRRKERKRGGVTDLEFDTAGRRGNDAACGLHATSSSTLQEGRETRETRRHVVSTSPMLIIAQVDPQPEE